MSHKPVTVNTSPFLTEPRYHTQVHKRSGYVRLKT